VIAQITPELEQQLLDWSLGARPEEACGLWLGTCSGGLWRVELALVAANLARDRPPGSPRRFRVDPPLQQRAQTLASARSRRVLGSWHSHPAGGSRPSRLDLEFAGPGSLLGIVALWPAGGACLRLWTIQTAGLREVPRVELDWPRQGAEVPSENLGVQ